MAAAAKVDGRPNRSKRSRMGSGCSRTSKEGLQPSKLTGRRHGYHVSTRGRIAREIVEAFEAAH
ncbi:hypothetical protein GS942_13855 [Rhodococcus hoagii]|nr:hypothetical protein [Prescottella equi]